MRRIVIALLATAGGLVALLGYRTSWGATADVAALAAAGEPGGPASATAPPSSTGTSTGTGAGSGGQRTTSTPTPGSSSGTGSSSGSGSASSGSSTSSTSSASGLRDGTYTGSAASTRYGDVQVVLTVSDGRIAGVEVPVSPDGSPRDRQISQTAIPRLVSATLSAQSASVDFVSGATYTSRGYEQSLQSALDQAKG